jgi:hypothetical protein
MLQRQISPIKWRNSELSRTVVTGLIMKLGIVEKKTEQKCYIWHLEEWTSNTSSTTYAGQTIQLYFPVYNTKSRNCQVEQDEIISSSKCICPYQCTHQYNIKFEWSTNAQLTMACCKQINSSQWKEPFRLQTQSQTCLLRVPAVLIRHWLQHVQLVIEEVA